MQKVRVPINSFQYGEISDSLRMRLDSQIYGASAQSLENMVVMAEGSVKKRPGLKYHYNYPYAPTGQALSHLFRFVFDENERYIVSVEDRMLRIFYLEQDGSITAIQNILYYDDNGLNTTLPFSGQYLQEITTAQYGDVMIICHETFKPIKLTRIAIDQFEASSYQFDYAESPRRTYSPFTKFQPQGVTLEPSLYHAGPCVVTTSEPYFDIAKHTGVILRYGESEIQLRTWISPTQMHATNLSDLKTRLQITNPLRTIEKSQIVEVTHIGHGMTAGNTIVLEGASSVGGIPIQDLNTTFSIAEVIDENTYRIQVATSASSIEGADGGGIVTIKSNAPTLNWSEQSWNDFRGYPSAVTFHENRLCFAGTTTEPDSIWMSKIGEFYNHDVADANDADAIAITAATGDVSEIRYLISNRDLQIFSTTSESYIPSYNGQTLTPTNVQIKRQTPFGSEHVQPTSIDGATIFASSGGRIVREFLYTDAEQAYSANAISTLASHMINAPRCLAVAHSAFDLPDSYAVMTMTDGTAAAFSSNRAEKKASWTKFTTNGSFCSVVSIGDRMFANAHTQHGELILCEFTEDIGLDFWYKVDTNSYFFSVPDLFKVGDLLDVILVNGDDMFYIGQHEVNSAKFINFNEFSDFEHDAVYIGYKFNAEVVTNPIDSSIGNGPLTGEIMGVSAVVVDMKDTKSMLVNGRRLLADNEFTGKKEFKILGYGRDPVVRITQEDPLPMQVNGLIAELIF